MRSTRPCQTAEIKEKTEKIVNDQEKGHQTQKWEFFIKKGCSKI